MNTNQGTVKIKNNHNANVHQHKNAKDRRFDPIGNLIDSNNPVRIRAFAKVVPGYKPKMKVVVEQLSDRNVVLEPGDSTVGYRNCNISFRNR